MTKKDFLISSEKKPVNNIMLELDIPPLYSVFLSSTPRTIVIVL